jgi:TRAP-type C4-dicarboxylate transport system permease small subunit
MTFLRWLGVVHDRVTVLGFALAAIFVGVIAAIFCYEVVVRHFFGAPTAWTYDIGSFLLAGVIFLSVPEMTRRGAHVHVNLIFDYLSPAGARLLRYFIGVLAVAGCLIATWITGSEAWRQYVQDVWTLTALPIPKWWVSILVPYGFLSAGLHFLRALARAPGATLSIGAGP